MSDLDVMTPQDARVTLSPLVRLRMPPVVSGDVNVAEVRRLVEKYYGSIPRARCQSAAHGSFWCRPARKNWTSRPRPARPTSPCGLQGPAAGGSRPGGQRRRAGRTDAWPRCAGADHAGSRKLDGYTVRAAGPCAGAGEGAARIADSAGASNGSTAAAQHAGRCPPPAKPLSRWLRCANRCADCTRRACVRLSSTASRRSGRPVKPTSSMVFSTRHVSWAATGSTACRWMPARG